MIRHPGDPLLYHPPLFKIFFFQLQFYFIFKLYKIVLVLPNIGSMHDTGCLGLVHWDDPEGWYGEGGGFRMGNTCIPMANSFTFPLKAFL